MSVDNEIRKFYTGMELPTISSKEPERQELQRHYEEFFAAGGKVENLPPFACAEK